jgi:hypothetical protein
MSPSTLPQEWPTTISFRLPKRQVLGQLDGVGDQLTDVHRHSWLDGRSGLSRTALIPFHDNEVILEEPVEPDSRHLGLTRTAVQLQQDRALGVPASHQQPLPYAPKRQWLESRNAPRDGSPLRIAYRPCACRRSELREKGHEEIIPASSGGLNDI